MDNRTKISKRVSTRLDSISDLLELVPFPCHHAVSAAWKIARNDGPSRFSVVLNEFIDQLLHMNRETHFAVQKTRIRSIPPIALSTVAVAVAHFGIAES